MIRHTWSRTARSLSLLLAVVGAAGVGAGAGCIDYDPRLAVSLPDGGADLEGQSDLAAIPCSQPNVAHLSVEGFAYHIVCGCAETEGKTCTVAPQTTVVWTFSDSEQHNVTSVLARFGMSTDTLAGEFSYVFTSPGEYRYGCTIHAADMSGYQIVVRDPARSE